MNGDSGGYNRNVLKEIREEKENELIDILRESGYNKDNVRDVAKIMLNKYPYEPINAVKEKEQKVRKILRKTDANVMPDNVDRIMINENEKFFNEEYIRNLIRNLINITNDLLSREYPYDEKYKDYRRELLDRIVKQEIEEIISEIREHVGSYVGSLIRDIHKDRSVSFESEELDKIILNVPVVEHIRKTLGGLDEEDLQKLTKQQRGLCEELNYASMLEYEEKVLKELGLEFVKEHGKFVGIKKIYNEQEELEKRFDKLREEAKKSSDKMCTWKDLKSGQYDEEQKEIKKKKTTRKKVAKNKTKPTTKKQRKKLKKQ